MPNRHAPLAAHHRSIDRHRWDWGMLIAMYAWVFAQSNDEICGRRLWF